MRFGHRGARRLFGWGAGHSDQPGWPHRGGSTVQICPCGRGTLVHGRGGGQGSQLWGAQQAPPTPCFPLSLGRRRDPVGRGNGGTVVDRGGGEDRGELDTACACPGGWGSYWPMLPWGWARQQEGIPGLTFVVEELRSTPDEEGSSEAAAGGGIEAGEWRRCQLLVRGES